MTTFEVQSGGVTYEVEAPDQDSAIRALQNLIKSAPKPEVSGMAAGPVKTVRQPGDTGTASDVANAIGSGLVTGTQDTIGLPGSLGSLTAEGAAKFLGMFGINMDEASKNAFRKSIPFVGQMPNASEVAEATGFEPYEAKTTPGKYAGTAASFVPGAAAMGGIGGGLKAAMQSAVRYGIIPALFSETAGQATEGTAVEPYARTGAALVAGGATALLSRPGTAAAALKANLPKGATEANITAAEKLIADGERMGIRLTWPEALSQTTKGKIDMTDLQRVIEKSSGGAPVMSEFMAGRPDQIAKAGAGAMDDVSRGAVMTDPVKAGLTVQSISEKTLTGLRQRINKVTEALYASGGKEMVDDVAFNAISKDPLFKQALAAVKTDPVYSRSIVGMPDRSVAVFNEVKKYLDDLAGAAGAGGKNAAAAAYGSVARGAKTAATEASDDYALALERQAALRRNVLNPAESGPLGKMAATDDLAAQGKALFPTAPLEGSDKIVAQTVRRLVRTDKNAAFQLVRSNLKQTFDEATQATIAGNNPWGGAKFAAAVKGNAQQAKNLEAALRALPDGASRWKGMNRFFEVLEATGKRQRPGSMTAFNEKELEALSQTGLVVSGAKAVRTLGKSALDYIAEFKLGANTEAMARIITDPKAGALLRKLAIAQTLTERQRLAGLLIYYVKESTNKDPVPPSQ